MRIIAGEWRRRQLAAPAGRATRPTSERLREALFASLGERVRGAVWVDAYAGSGAIGFEALSRGAARAVWIETAPPALRALRANAAALGLAAPEVVAVPALRAWPALLRKLAPGGADLWYFDPPYDQVEERSRLLAALARHPALFAPRALVLVECRAALPWQPPWPELRRLRQGDGEIVFFHPP